MQEKSLTSLAELESEIDSIRQLIQTKRRTPHQVLSKPLFRGHADESWKLTTTLQRCTKRQYSVLAYNGVLCATACAAASLTDRSWPMEHEPQLKEDYFFTPPNYEFMAHARHHGFPTPLLDWTQSLYVALFFAFQEAIPNRNVAIYTYVEAFIGAKSWWVGAPSISLLGPNVATHRRHFLQQGQYTVAVEKINDSWHYCDHEHALVGNRGRSQDVIFKFTLPGALRNDILRKLQEMNINAYTLLGDENSLMSTLAFKEITMREETN